MAMYRGQTTTMQKIQAISTLRITTREEAIAYLRSMANINLQIADILQRQNMQEVSARNNARAAEELAKAEKEQAAPEQLELPLDTPAPATFDEEEGHTESQKKSRVERLKKAVK